ncbi:MAG: LamG domain-containing protein [Candidatus Zixiibacteriota bacterium]
MVSLFYKTMLFLLISCPVLGQSLRGYWPFNETYGDTAHDSSVYANHGIVNGADWIFGQPLFDNALQFDGIDDNVMVPDSPSLNVSGAMSISLWFNPAFDIDSGFQENYHLVGKWHGSGGDPQYRTGYFVGLNVYYDGKLSIGLGFGSGTWTFLTSNKSNWNNGQWYFIAITYDRSLESDNVKIYIDGILDAVYDETRVIAPNTLDLYINIDPAELWHEGHTYFPGLIDEVRLYSAPLSISNITDLQNGREPVVAIKAPTLSRFSLMLLALIITGSGIILVIIASTGRAGVS